MAGVTAFYQAYDEVRVALPNRPVLVCRPLTLAWAARFLAALERDAREVVLAEFPRAIGLSRRARRELERWRDDEVIAVVEAFLYPDLAITSVVPTPGPGHRRPTIASLDDKLAEYAAAYGGPPDSSLAWPLFLALVERTGRFYARRELAMLQSVYHGASPLVDAKAGYTLRARQRDLERVAYPFAEPAPLEFPVNEGRTGPEAAN